MSDSLQHDTLETGNHTDDGAMGGSDATANSTGEHSSGQSETEEHLTVSTDQHELHASGSANAVLTGDSSDDHLYGAQHDDVLDGGDGNDVLGGGDGDDVLIAGGQTDGGTNSLDGGAGDDVLVAGGTATRELHDFLQQHQDVADAVRADANYASLHSLIDASSAMPDIVPTSVTPAAGSNTFAFHDGNGHDQVFNFHADGDRIQIDRGINGSDINDIDSLVQHLSIDGDNVTIDFGQGNSVTLVGVDVAHLSADNVIWA